MMNFMFFFHFVPSHIDLGVLVANLDIMIKMMCSQDGHNKPNVQYFYCHFKRFPDSSKLQWLGLGFNFFELSTLNFQLFEFPILNCCRTILNSDISTFHKRQKLKFYYIEAKKKYEQLA